MSEIAIQVSHLSKQFNIGKTQARYRTFRDAIADSIAAPFQRFKHLLKRSEYGASDLTETIWALKDVSFEVQRGDVVGVIGRNGAGKSTLLKILARITEPTEGSVDLYGRVGSLLEVGTGFHAELTGRENIYLNGAILGMKRQEINRKFDEMVAFSEIEKFIDTPVKHYSTGMYLRLAFAVAAHLEPEILLVDEVLAVGDASFQKKCLGKMGEVAREGRTVLFVSHNLEAVLNLCPTSLLLDGGRLAFLGDSETAVKCYLSGLSNSASAMAGSVLFAAPRDSVGRGTRLTRLEMLDGDLCPRESLYTWDTVVLRATFQLDHEVQRGQVILDILDDKERRLVVLDTGPKVSLRKGENQVECTIPRLPLPAGEYTLGAGLTIAKTEWLWRDLRVARMHVFARDVFEIGRPPTSSRMAFAVEHSWKFY